MGFLFVVSASFSVLLLTFLGILIIIIIIIIITIFIWRPSWSSDHSRRALAHVNFFTLTVTFEDRTNIVAD